MMPPSRQDDGNIRAPALACVVAVRVWRSARGHTCCCRFCGVVLSDFRTPPSTMPLALSFDLGTAPSRSTAFVFVKSASSFTFDLYERSWALVVGGLTGQHLGLVLSSLAVIIALFLLGQSRRLIDRLATFTRLTRTTGTRLTRTARLVRGTRL